MHFRILVALVLFAAAACCGSPPDTATPADPPAAAVEFPPEVTVPMPGLVYAQQHCAACHAVRADQLRSPHLGAPPFRSIANTPGMSGYALTVWMRTSHPSMPNFIVESDRIEDIWAYMATMKE